MALEPQDYAHVIYKQANLMRKLVKRLAKKDRNLKSAQKKLVAQNEMESFLSKNS